VKLFRARKDEPPRAPWVIEVDYGAGWIVYGPPYPERESAESLARELRTHGHAARVRPTPR
jgi:hypothetical protein